MTETNRRATAVGLIPASPLKMQNPFFSRAPELTTVMEQRGASFRASFNDADSSGNGVEAEIEPVSFGLTVPDGRPPLPPMRKPITPTRHVSTGSILPVHITPANRSATISITNRRSTNAGVATLPEPSPTKEASGYFNVESNRTSGLTLNVSTTPEDMQRKQTSASPRPNSARRGTALLSTNLVSPAANSSRRGSVFLSGNSATDSAAFIKLKENYNATVDELNSLKSQHMLLQEKFDDLNEQFKSEQDKVHSLESKNETTRVSLDMSERKINDLSDKTKNLERNSVKKLSKMEAEYNDLKNSNSELTRKLEATTREISSLKQENVRVNNENIRANADVSNLKNEIQSLQMQLSHIEEDWKNDSECIHEEREAEAVLLKEAGNTIEILQSKLTEKTQESIFLAKKMSEVSAEAENDRKKYNELNNNISLLEREVRNLKESNLEKEKSITSLSLHNSALTRDAQNALDSRKEIGDKNRRFNEQLESKSETIKQLKEIIASTIPEAAKNIQNDLESKLAKMTARVDALVSYQSKIKLELSSSTNHSKSQAEYTSKRLEETLALLKEEKLSKENLEARFRGLETKLHNVKENNERAINDIEKRKAEAESKITHLNEVISDHQIHHTALNEKFNFVQAELVTERTRAKDLQIQIELEKKKSDSIKEDAVKKIESLKKSIEHREIVYNDMKQSNERYQTEINSLLKSQEILIKNQEKVTADRDNIFHKHEELVVSYNKLASRNEKLSAENLNHVKEYEVFREKHDALKVSYEKVSNDFEISKKIQQQEYRPSNSVKGKSSDLRREEHDVLFNSGVSNRDDFHSNRVDVESKYAKFIEDMRAELKQLRKDRRSLVHDLEASAGYMPSLSQSLKENASLLGSSTSSDMKQSVLLKLDRIIDQAERSLKKKYR